MNENISSKINHLLESYLRNQISLNDFQFHLEPLLGSFEGISKDDAEEIKRIVNQLEVIIYTIPESEQKGKVELLIPNILQYVKRKSS